MHRSEQSCTCPGYVSDGNPRRAAVHEHWHGEPYGKQVTVRNNRGMKVALVPVDGDKADDAVRRARLVIWAPELERIVWAALSGQDGWQERARDALRATGFLPSTGGKP
jgi:hypothetical protein